MELWEKQLSCQSYLSGRVLCPKLILSVGAGICELNQAKSMLGIRNPSSSSSFIISCADVGKWCNLLIPQVLYLSSESLTSKVSSKLNNRGGESEKEVSLTHDLSLTWLTRLALNTQRRQAPICPFCRREPCTVVCELPHPGTNQGVWVPSPHSPKPMILTKCTKLLFLFPPFRSQVLISFPQVCSSLKRSPWLLCQRILSD